ncbi:MAG TPA: hypothetical protein VF469_18780 [Kofleriaceae bacterium]
MAPTHLEYVDGRGAAPGRRFEVRDLFDGAVIAQAPFGGVKHSGIGGEGSRHGLDDYRDAVSIDDAGGIWLVYPETTSPEEVTRLMAAELAHARASGLTVVVTTIAPSGRFWLNDAAFERIRNELAAWKILGGDFARVMREVWG